MFCMVNKSASLLIHEEIYRTIRLRIMLGQTEPGKIFSIRSLAKEFSVSMTPIREATRRLVAERALMMSSSGRISVPRIDAKRAKELVSVRLLLEPELAARAIPRSHSALIERLTDISRTIEEMLDKKNPEGYMKANLDFDRTIYLRAQAPLMFALLETIWLQSGPSMNAALKKKHISVKLFVHSTILSALRSKNQAELAKSIRNKINTNLEVLLQ